MDRSEKLIEYGDSWFSPKCIEVQPRDKESAGGRATGWMRGTGVLPISTKLRIPVLDARE